VFVQAANLTVQDRVIWQSLGKIGPEIITALERVSDCEKSTAGTFFNDRRGSPPINLQLKDEVL
jgi:hypothetical protein